MFCSVPGSRPDDVTGRWSVEAAGVGDMLRVVSLTVGETDEGFDVAVPIVVEGCISVASPSAAAEPTSAYGPTARPRPSPVAADPVILAEVSGPQLQHGLGVALQPELLRPLDPPVDLLDGTLHRGAGEGQPQAAVRWVVHLVPVVLHVAHGIRQDFAGVVLLGARWRLPAPGRLGPQLPQQRLDLSRPGQPPPGLVQHPRRRLV